MLKLVFNEDGSIYAVDLPTYVIQGSDQNDELAVAFANSNINAAGISAIAYFTLPNGDKNSLTFSSTDTFELNGKTYQCKKLLLTEAQTLYVGVLYVSILVQKNSGSVRQYTYNLRIQVNPSGYEPDDSDSRISNAQYQNLVTTIGGVGDRVTTLESEVGTLQDDLDDTNDRVTNTEDEISKISNSLSSFEKTSNKVYTINSSSSNNTYPSTKAVYEYVRDNTITQAQLAGITAFIYLYLERTATGHITVTSRTYNSTQLGNMFSVDGSGHLIYTGDETITQNSSNGHVYLTI